MARGGCEWSFAHFDPVLISLIFFYLWFQADVHCFLLTDILLICKAIAKKGHGTLKVRRTTVIGEP